MANKTSKKGLLNISEFALLIGVDEKAVRYAVKKGRLKVRKIKGKNFVEPVAGEKEWHARIDKTASKKGKQARGVEPTSKFEYDAPTYQGLTVADAEQREKVYKAKLSEMKYLEQSGELIRKGDVQREAFEIGRKTRDAIIGLPPRIAHELAAITDPRKLEVKLIRELQAALVHLVNGDRK